MPSWNGWLQTAQAEVKQGLLEANEQAKQALSVLQVRSMAWKAEEQPSAGFPLSVAAAP